VLAAWLASQGLPGIAIGVEAGRVKANPVSGKFRQVLRKT